MTTPSSFQLLLLMLLSLSAMVSSREEDFGVSSGLSSSYQRDLLSERERRKRLCSFYQWRGEREKCRVCLKCNSAGCFNPKSRKSPDPKCNKVWKCDKRKKYCKKNDRIIKRRKDRRKNRPTRAPKSNNKRPTRRPTNKRPTRRPTNKRPRRPPTLNPPTRPPTNTKSQEAGEWLEAHNRRRTAIYKKHNLPPSDLKWSEGVAASAQNYANTLASLNGCQIEHGVGGDSYGGENLAYYWSTGGYAFPPESVLRMWYDEEENLSLYQKLHYTQVAWRATEYLGCGTAIKDTGGGKCIIQVCRYVRAGNCNIGSDWLSKMLSDYSPCGPECPPEGCF